MLAGICKSWKYSHLHLTFTVTQFYALNVFVMCRFVTNYLGIMVDRFFLFGFGFNWIHTRGVPAPTKDAPILVVSPHTCILDMFIVSLYKVPTFLARADIRRIPLFGCMWNDSSILSIVCLSYSLVLLLLMYANFGAFVDNWEVCMLSPPPPIKLYKEATAFSDSELQSYAP